MNTVNRKELWMLTTIIFSKDRPLQLDLCLQSVSKNWINEDIIVVFKDSSEKYLTAYEKLKTEHPKIIFVRQSCGFGDALKIAMSYCCNSRYIAFLTDDNIVYKKCNNNIEEIHSIMSIPDICCISMRMGLNITKRDNHNVPLPIFSKIGNYAVWNRTNYLAQSYWNYPLSLDGHIFRKETIYWIIDEIIYSSSGPNKLEQLMQRFFFEIPSFCACEMTSCVVNSPNNRVQDHFQNWHGQTYGYHQDNLLEIYENGDRIKFENILFTGIDCPHKEVDILQGLD